MSHRTAMTLSASGPFHFRGTVRAHGWVTLAPNGWDPERDEMHRAHRLDSGRTAWLVLSAGGDGTAVAAEAFHRGELDPRDREGLRRDVGRMLRLDEDLAGFHDLCRERGGPWAEVTRGLGRLLRSPTVFEDTVKTICTTNVRWEGTGRMVRELVQAYGDPVEAGPPSSAGPSPPRGLPRRTFPTPAALAEVPGEAFARRAGLGYRAPYVHELARRVASGELDLEELADADLPTRELKEELLGIRGVGPYAASTLLMLLGRYEEPAVDSVFREFVAETYFGGATPSDEEARAVYESWGPWAYLAYWFDLWRSRA